LFSFTLAFFLFRLFDIWKPFPIPYVESMGPSWWSITADDLLAGMMAGGVVGEWITRQSVGSINSLAGTNLS